MDAEGIAERYRLLGDLGRKVSAAQAPRGQFVLKTSRQTLRLSPAPRGQFVLKTSRQTLRLSPAKGFI
jgi:hypothetical protein